MTPPHKVKSNRPKAASQRQRHGNKLPQNQRHVDFIATKQSLGRGWEAPLFAVAQPKALRAKPLTLRCAKGEVVRSGFAPPFRAFGATLRAQPPPSRTMKLSSSGFAFAGRKCYGLTIMPSDVRSLAGFAPTAHFDLGSLRSLGAKYLRPPQSLRLRCGRVRCRSPPIPHAESVPSLFAMRPRTARRYSGLPSQNFTPSGRWFRCAHDKTVLAFVIVVRSLRVDFQSPCLHFSRLIGVILLRANFICLPPFTTPSGAWFNCAHGCLRLHFAR